MITVDNPNSVRCPKCGSTQITANKNGFSGGKAVAGAVLTGGIGILAGTIGSKKVIITCLNCGNQFKPGEGGRPNNQKIEWKTFERDKTDSFKVDRNSPVEKRKGGIILLIFFGSLSLIFFLIDWIIIAWILLFFAIVGLVVTFSNKG